MKKSKMLSIALSFLLIFTTVFAGAGSVYAVSNEVDSSELTPNKPINYNSVDWDDEEAAFDVVYDAMSLFTVEEEGYYPVNISKKGYYTHFVSAYLETDTPVYIGLLDPEGNMVAGPNGDEPLPVEPYEDEETGTTEYCVYTSFETYTEKTGTYYIYFYAEGVDEFLGDYVSYYFPQSTKSANWNVTGKGTQGFSNNSSGYSWFKVQASQNGYLTVKMGDSEVSDVIDKYSIRLYDANKSKCLSGGNVTLSSANRYTAHFGVLKGTYYIRVYNKSAEYFEFTASRYYVTDKSGATKEKANRIYKAGSTKKGIVTATQSSTYSDYYYFKLTKKQKVKLTLTSKSGGYDGGLKMTVYKKGSSKVLDTFYLPKGTKSYNVTIENGAGSGLTDLTAGTYYIRVQKWKTGSGYYTIKWR